MADQKDRRRERPTLRIRKERLRALDRNDLDHVAGGDRHPAGGHQPCNIEASRYCND
jgi:hypothetical protein